MKQPEEIPENLLEALRRILHNRPDPRFFLMSRQGFEDYLAQHIRFWRAIGKPNYEILIRLMVWEELQRDRQLTAEVFGLNGGRECVRKMLDTLYQNLLKNTSPGTPDEKP